jgi:hypothetical protein
MSDPTRSSTATITIAPSNITVSLTPARGSLTVAQALSFTAQLTNDVNNGGVTWSATAGSFKHQVRPLPFISRLHRQA